VIKKAPLSPVLPVVMQGLAQYSHLISVDFLADLIAVLLQICETEQKDHPYNQIQCCASVFKTMKAHGDSLNVDLKDFYEILYLSRLL
jgi:nucleolar complex protein 3